MRKDTRSPKQEQSVAPQNGPWSRQKIQNSKKKKVRDAKLPTLLILCVREIP